MSIVQRALLRFLFSKTVSQTHTCSCFSTTSKKGIEAKKFTYCKAFDGPPTAENFRLESFELPKLNDNDILCEALYLSVDPYMRAYYRSGWYTVGDTMIGTQVARVLDSKNKNYSSGSLVVASIGWQTRAVINPDAEKPKVYPVPDLEGLSPSLALGGIGMPGNTAYFGLLEVCKPVKGETVIVSGAAGAVGSLVGQIAKIKGCKAIGICGSDEKVSWIVNDLGFDGAFNYKTAYPATSLKKLSPEGIDCYFDNVGGLLSDTVMRHMNKFGRVAVCGSISAYNTKDLSVLVPNVQGIMVHKELTMEGFVVYRWLDRWLEGLEQMKTWILEGKIQCRETVVEGFENMPSAFIGLLEGQNIGKMLVKA